MSLARLVSYFPRNRYELMESTRLCICFLDRGKFLDYVPKAAYNSKTDSFHKCLS